MSALTACLACSDQTGSAPASETIESASDATTHDATAEQPTGSSQPSATSETGADNSAPSSEQTTAQSNTSEQQTASSSNEDSNTVTVATVTTSAESTTSVVTAISSSAAASSSADSNVSDASTTSSAEPADLTSIAGQLDGYLYKGECNGGSASFECPLSNCQDGVFEQTTSVVLGGQPDTAYAFDLHVYGVVELRSDYHDGVRRQGSKSNAQSEKDFFYEGGTYTPGKGYNVYALRVEPAVDGVAAASEGGNNYFLNARDGSGEGHETWELNYEATIRANGGSTISFKAYDPNCLQIMNNRETARPSAGSGPNGAIVVEDVNQASPSPVDFEQPLSTGGRNGQWIYIDVVGVTAEG